jgi:lipopolysaccharide export system permease protein
MLYVNKIDAKSGDLHNVLIEDGRQPGVNNTVIARSGKLFGEPKEMIYYLRLFDGTINQMDMQDRSSHTIHFETYDIRLDLKGVISSGGISSTKPDEMVLADLKAYLRQIKVNQKDYNSALLKYHKKFSIPFACLAMGLLALPLGIVSRHSKKSVGIGLGLIFFLLYYMLLSVGSTLGEDGRYPPVVGMWMPNLILGGFGIYLLIRTTKERPLAFNGLEQLVEKTMQRINYR